MNHDLIGAAFVFVLASASGIAHLAAARDPYRNFFTQLVHTWYDAHSPYEGEGLRRVLFFSAVVHFLIAAGCGVAIFLELVG